MISDNHTAFYALSRSWRHDAETWRREGMKELAKYAARRHIETRERARTLAKQAKAVKP